MLAFPWQCGEMQRAPVWSWQTRIPGPLDKLHSLLSGSVSSSVYSTTASLPAFSVFPEPVLLIVKLAENVLTEVTQCHAQQRLGTREMLARA
jgi:hypothetical protein